MDNDELGAIAATGAGGIVSYDRIQLWSDHIFRNISYKLYKMSLQWQFEALDA
jgi:hypothetical protein